MRFFSAGDGTIRKVFTHSFYFFLASIFFCLTFISCSDTEPEVDDAEVFLVLDYSSTPPVSRLAVFVEVESDVRLASGITVQNEETGFKWTCENPIRFDGKDKKSWAGSTSLSVPLGMSIPCGKYTLTYTDFAEREAEVEFYLDYPSELLEASSLSFPDILDSSAVKNIALYNSDSSLLYFGEEKEEWVDSSSILSDFKSAKTLRVCYTIKESSVISLMPEEELCLE